MKVAISVPGRFHLFYLAQELLKKDYLSQLITSYPKFEVLKYGIPKEKVSSILVKELLFRGYQSFPGFLKNLYNPHYFIHEAFDRLAVRALKPADIVVGGSSVFLHTMRLAKERGMATIVERGSSHIVYQDQTLKEEYDRFGVKIRPFMLPHSKIIEKELREYEESDYIAIPSLFVKKTFIEKGVPERKMIHVPYGVNLSSFRPVPKKDDVFRVVFAGGMVIRKGVHYLLQAFSELNLPDSELVLAGGLSDEIKPFFKKYNGKFDYLGRLLQTELYRFYSNGSVFVMMSVEEGLAMVIPQAMACGLPIIATATTGAEDIVRDGKDGYIIPARDTEKLKEKLVFLYGNKGAREAMGASAKERVKTGFTWHDYGEKIIGAYLKIIHTRNQKQ